MAKIKWVKIVQQKIKIKPLPIEIQAKATSLKLQDINATSEYKH